MRKLVVEAHERHRKIVGAWSQFAGLADARPFGRVDRIDLVGQPIDQVREPLPIRRVQSGVGHPVEAFCGFDVQFEMGDVGLILAWDRRFWRDRRRRRRIVRIEVSDPLTVAMGAANLATVTHMRAAETAAVHATLPVRAVPGIVVRMRERFATPLVGDGISAPAGGEVGQAVVGRDVLRAGGG